MRAITLFIALNRIVLSCGLKYSRSLLYTMLTLSYH